MGLNKNILDDLGNENEEDVLLQSQKWFFYLKIPSKEFYLSVLFLLSL